ncbi:unnamed protein product, partial [Mesorhabditis spiculigera]
MEVAGEEEQHPVDSDATWSSDEEIRPNVINIVAQAPAVPGPPSLPRKIQRGRNMIMKVGDHRIYWQTGEYVNDDKE